MLGVAAISFDKGASDWHDKAMVVRAGGAVLAIAAAVVMIAGQATSAQTSCPYMSHNQFFTVAIGGFTHQVMHGNYGVGYAQGKKLTHPGVGYGNRVITCHGLNCPTRSSPFTDQVGVVVQATGDFNIVRSRHSALWASGGDIICRDAV